MTTGQDCGCGCKGGCAQARPDPLRAMDSAAGEGAGPWGEGGDRAADGAAMLADPRDLQALDGLLAALSEKGAAAATPVWLALGELQALAEGSERVLAGDLQALAPQLEGIAPWPDGLRSGRWGREHEQQPALRLPVGAVLCAAHLAGAAAAGGQAEVGQLGALRALTALLWRAEPLARALHAARAWAAGRLAAGALEPVLVACAQQLRAPPDAKTLLELWRQGPRVLDRLDLPDLPPLVRKPPFSAWLLPENQAWAHCALGLSRGLGPLPDLPKTSPGPGRVEPASLCGSAPPIGGWKLVIEGQAFGAQDRWGVVVNGQAAQIDAWTDQRIELRSSALRPGCNRVEWSWAATWGPDDEGVGAACAEALRLPRLTDVLRRGAEALLAASTAHWLQPGSVSLLPPRIERFTSSAAGQPLPPCTPVTLAWALTDLPCAAHLAAHLAALHLELRRDGQLLAGPLPSQGHFEDRAALDADAEYELLLASHDAAGQACAPQRATLRVQRAAKALRLSGAERVDDGMPQVLRVESPCPAPAGGLTVALQALPADALSLPASVLIPPGQRGADVPVQAGARCGAAELLASAADHAAARHPLCVRRAPGPLLFTPPAEALPACAAFTLNVELPCADAGLRAFAMDAQGVRHALTAGPLPGAAGCQRSQRLSLRSAGLPPGSYRLLLENALGSSQAADGFEVVPAPRVLQAPTQIAVSDPCGAAAQTLRVRVVGADAVRFEPAGLASQTVPRPAAGGECSEWTALFAFDYERDLAIDVVPLHQAQAGPARTVAVALSMGVAARSTYLLRGPPFMGATATLTRIDTAPEGQPQHSSAGSIAHGEEREFTLSACLFTRFAFRYTQMGSPVAGETPDVLGHPDAPPMASAHQV